MAYTYQDFKRDADRDTVLQRNKERSDALNRQLRKKLSSKKTSSGGGGGSSGYSFQDYQRDVEAQKDSNIKLVTSGGGSSTKTSSGGGGSSASPPKTDREILMETGGGGSSAQSQLTPSEQRRQEQLEANQLRSEAINIELERKRIAGISDAQARQDKQRYQGRVQRFNERVREFNEEAQEFNRGRPLRDSVTADIGFGMQTFSAEEYNKAIKESSQELSGEDFFKQEISRQAEFKQSISPKQLLKQRQERLRKLDFKKSDFVDTPVTATQILTTPQGVIAASRNIGKTALTGAETFAAVTRLNKIVPNIPIREKTAVSFAGDTLLFAGFSPALRTTPSFSRDLERQAQLVTLKELSKRPFKTTSVAAGTQRSSLATIRATRSFGGIKQEVELAGRLSKSQQKGAFGLEGNVYVIPRGFATGKTSGVFKGITKVGDEGIIKSGIIDIRQFEFGAKALAGQQGKQSVAVAKTVQADFITRRKFPLGELYTTKGKYTQRFGFGVAEQIPAQNKQLGNIYRTFGFKASNFVRRGDLRRMDIKFTSKGVGKKITITPKEAKGFTSFQGRGKQSSDVFLRNLYGEEQAASSQAIFDSFKIKAPSIRPVKIRPKANIPRTIQPKQQSEFYGRGLYERTEFQGGFQPSINTGRVSIRPFQNINFAQGFVSRVNSRNVQASRGGQKSGQKLNLRGLQAPKLDNRQVIKQQQILRQQQRLGQKQRLQQKLVIRQQTPFFNPNINLRLNLKTPGKIPPSKDYLKAGEISKKKRRGYDASDIELLPQGFTAKALKLKKLRIV